MKPNNAASVVAQRSRVLPRSISGGGGGPFRFREGLDDVGEEVESKDAVELFSSRRRAIDPFRRSFGRGDCDARRPSGEGRTNFRCFEAGSISSRSTGTPRDTRNSRRMRERTQSGGCRGGGAMSWFQRSRERSESSEGGSAKVLAEGRLEWAVVGKSTSR